MLHDINQLVATYESLLFYVIDRLYIERFLCLFSLKKVGNNLTQQ